MSLLLVEMHHGSVATPLSSVEPHQDAMTWTALVDK